MKASDLMTARPHLDVGVYGDPGAGKTRWAATAPRPLILLSEHHGLASIHEANPDADVEVVETTTDLLTTLRALKRGAPTEVDGQPAWEWGDGRVCQTVVLDTLTDLQRLLMRHVVLGPAADDTSVALGDTTYTHWGRLAEIVEALLRDLRALPVNTVVLCLADTTEDDAGRRRTVPMLSGRVGKQLAQWFAAFGFAAKRSGEDGVVYGIAWELGGAYVTKPAPGFPSYSISTRTPGQTSLGSLALATIGARGVTVPHYDHDSADYVRAEGGEK